MKIMMVHSDGVSTWANIGQSWVIWSYEDAQKVSYHLAKPNWYLLHKHLLGTETWNNIGDKMDQLNDSKLVGEMFYG